MIWRKSGKIEWLESDQLSSIGVKHGWFSRQGGLSKGSFESLNIKHGMSDPQENVAANRELALAALGLKSENMVFIRHEFKDKILDVEKEKPSTQQDYFSADAVFSTDSKVVLAQGIADCGTIIISDKNAKILALVHSGWQPTRLNIVEKVVQKFISSGFQPDQLLASLGPMACGKCYEFGPEARQLFEGKYITQKGDQLFLDVRAKIHDQLKDSGVLEIDDCGVCTIEDQNFFSFRRDKDEHGECGRFMTVVSLPPKPAN